MKGQSALTEAVHAGERSKDGGGVLWWSEEAEVE